MEIESQKFMALEGVHAWARAVLVQVDRIETALRNMHPPVVDRLEPARVFQVERHLFLIAAHKLTEYADWVCKLDFLDPSTFSELFLLKEDIRTLRDMNEHVVDYFLGRGRKPDEWLHVTDGAIADASSTINSLIGNRLDWHRVAAVARSLIGRLPPVYYPPNSGAPER